MPRRIVLLTGDSGVGKTTVCQRVVELAAQRGFRCAGLLSVPAVDDNQQRIGTDAMDVATKKRRELTRADRVLRHIQVGRWSFNLDALDWGNALLRNVGECDLLVVDEIGRLELERKSGWMDAWGVLERHQFAMALVIVRPQLTEHISKLLGAKDTIKVTRATRDDLPEQIVDTLGKLVLALHAHDTQSVF
jgi:nucleoside-triphosphatase THEP1